MKTLRKSTLACCVVSLLMLGGFACDSPREDALEDQAEAQAEQMEDQADQLENRAEEIEDAEVPAPMGDTTLTSTNPAVDTALTGTDTTTTNAPITP